MKPETAQQEKQKKGTEEMQRGAAGSGDDAGQENETDRKNKKVRP